MIERIKQLENVLDAEEFKEQDGSKTYLVYTAWGV